MRTATYIWRLLVSQSKLILIDLTEVNKLTRSLDFFQEPIRDLNLDPRSTQQMIAESQKTKISEVAKMADFLDRMGTLDIVETTVFENR